VLVRRPAFGLNGEWLALGREYKALRMPAVVGEAVEGGTEELRQERMLSSRFEKANAENDGASRKAGLLKRPPSYGSPKIPHNSSIGSRSAKGAAGLTALRASASVRRARRSHCRIIFASV